MPIIIFDKANDDNLFTLCECNFSCFYSNQRMETHFLCKLCICFGQKL